MVNNQSDVERYAQRFVEIQEGQVISSAISKKTKTQEFFTFTTKDRKWSMAWSDESLVRSQLKKYWFVSTEGDVISVRGRKPKYIRKDTKNKRGYIKYHNTVDGKKKSINGHCTDGNCIQVLRHARCPAITKRTGDIFSGEAEQSESNTS